MKVVDWKRERTFACLWRIKAEHPLTWEVKISEISACWWKVMIAADFFLSFWWTYEIFWQRWINEMWVIVYPSPWFHSLPQSCMIHTASCVVVTDRSVSWFLILCSFTKDPFLMSFWLPLVRRSCRKVKLSLSQLESCWGRRGLPAHWHN